MLSRLYWICLVLGVLLVSACGGGNHPNPGGSSATPAVTTKTLSLQATLVDASGTNTNSLLVGQQGRVNVIASVRTVVTQDGRTTSDTTAPAPNVIVTITTGGGGQMNPSNGSVLTDADGKATATFMPSETTGAYTINATATLTGTGNATSAVNYQVRRDVEPKVTLRILDAQGREAVSIRAGEVIRIQAFVEDVVVQQTAAGTVKSTAAKGNIPVRFSSDGGLFDPSLASALTNSAGIAEVRFLPNITPGVFSMTATAEITAQNRPSATRIYQIVIPRLVIGSGSPFVKDVLALQSQTVRPGEPTQVTGEVRTEDGALFTLPVEVTFRSTCSANGGAQLLSPTMSADGKFRSTYQAGTGCSGRDEITAEANYPGQAFAAQARAQIEVLAPEPTAISYARATATLIALRGRGTATLPEHTTVTFRVTNPQGIPTPGAAVRFSLSAEGGGRSIATTNVVTDANGEAQARVSSGTAAGTFRVIATLVVANQSSQSEGIVVSTGTPDQNSFSLSVSTFNIEGNNIDGVGTTLTIRAADYYNNPPADGTRAFFTTEGGVVQPHCELVNGVCSVRLSSQNPRPANGRVSVLVTAAGDETFVDLNGNGEWNEGEPYEDLGEAFRDDNENGVWNPGEPFLDRNGNGTRDGGNNRYDGALCPGVGGCVGLSTVDVRQQAVIVFSTSQALVSFSPSQISVDELTPRTVVVSVSDANGNLPAAGSKIEFNVTNGKLLSEDTSFTVGNSNAPGPLTYALLIVGDGTPSTGVINATVTSPSGVVTMRQATITDINICATLPAPLPPGCSGGGSAEVGEITVSPAQFNVIANDSNRLAAVQVGVFAVGDPRRPFSGVVPSVTCSAQGASGITIGVPATIEPTSSTGTTTIGFRISATEIPQGEVTCNVQAGSKAAAVRFTATALAISNVALTPASHQVLPNMAGTALVSQFAAYAATTGGVQVPVGGVTPLVICAQGTASGFSVNGPVTVAPTSDQGISVVTFTVTSTGAPTGTASCTVSAQGKSVTATFAP
jgi:hypothetical protein